MSLLRKFKVMHMRINGFYGGKARWWLSAKQYDQKYNTKYTSAQKKWAYKHGFLPAVVERYGINDSNVQDFISLYDYCHIFPVNDIFRKWINDRVTTRDVLKPFSQYLPKQYFHLYRRDTSTQIVKLLDCPAEYEESYDGILQLIRDKGKVSLAKTLGTNFITLSYENGRYFFDGEEISDEDLILKIQDARNILVIMEYVESGSAMKALEPGNNNYLKLIFYNKHGDNPKVGQAYLSLNASRKTDSGELFEDEGSVSMGSEEDLDAKNRSDVQNSDTEIDQDDDTIGRNFMENEVVLPRRGKPQKVTRRVFVPVSLSDGSFNGGKQLSENNEITEIDTHPITGASLKGRIENMSEILSVIEQIGKFIPQIEYMSIDLVLTDNGFKMVDFSAHPSYPQVVGFNEEMTDYLKLKVRLKKGESSKWENKKKNFLKKSNTFLWIRLTRFFCPPKMRPLIYKWWYITVRDDLFSHNGVPLSTKRWAYKHGFLSYRLEQYGIDKTNYKNFISDYDYRYLRHINNKYRVWLEDKITVKYICSDYNQFFPEYYYHISVRNGEKRVIPLMDCPKDCGDRFEDIFKLVEKVGVLACKPQRGSQGQGFYKFSFHDGKYYLNHQEASKAEITEILNNEESQYLITEYIQMHPTLKKIYDGAVNTLRIIVFKKDGKTPVIGNAYMRFGSSKTGAVDNMGAGGMFVQVDIDTGRFYNGKIITENSILPCSHHPDTGELIEGYLPNWDLVKQGVIDLSYAMPQLEYLGFDVAISEDGMKLPEINRAPGYPKIEKFSPLTNDYLLYKLDQKRKKYDVVRYKKK